MVNENLLFEDVQVRSEKLDMDIPLQVYDRGDGIKIVSTKSLMAFFDTIKDKYKIRITKSKGEISFDNSGLPVYCLAHVNLKDGAGYDEDFSGESVPRTRQSEVASSHPYITAENRALSRAIRHYLQLPVAIYSSDEVPVDTANTDDAKAAVKDIIAKKAEAKAAENTKKAETPAPAEAEPAKAEPAKEEAAPVESGVIEAAADAIPAEEEPEDVSPVTPSDDAVETPVNEAELPVEQHPTGEPTESAKQAAKPNVVEEYNGSLICTFGAGKGKTVDEIMKAPECASFVEKIKSGKVKPPEGDKEKAAVINAIMNA